MAQNNIKLGGDWVKYSIDERIAIIADNLEVNGYEINREHKGYRRLMFRKNSRQWSQVYERERGTPFYFTVHGPEKEAATKDYWK